MNLLAQESVFRLTGLVGVILGLIGVIVPSLVYRGTRGEKYSFLNHYISELGETGVSRLAWLFNLALILSGICIVIAFVCLGLVLPGFWAKAGLVLGVITGVALSMVGVFPMNKMEYHGKAAIAYFRGGLTTGLVFLVCHDTAKRGKPGGSARIGFGGDDSGVSFWCLPVVDVVGAERVTSRS